MNEPMSDQSTDAVTDGPPPPTGPIAGQLRAGLLLAQLCGALLVILAVALIVFAFRGDDTDVRKEAVQVGFSLMMLPGLVVCLTARSARRRLSVGAASARLWGILTGAFTILAALPLLSHFSGALLIIVGLFTLTSALLLKRAGRA